METLNSEVRAANQLITVTQEMFLSRTMPTHVTSSSQKSASDGVQKAQNVLAKRPGTTISQKYSVTTNTTWGVWGIVFKKTSQSAKVSNKHGEYLEGYTQSESTWVFIPSFFSQCVELKFSNTLGSVQRSLRTYPIIRENHPIWGMCERGDTTGIQTLLSKREVSPFSIDHYGRTLLYVGYIAI